MEEILVQGNITEDLKRLGVNATRTYGDETTSYQVYEVSDEDFQKLSEDASKRNTDDDHWKNCGWRWAEGSNLGRPDTFVTVNQQQLFGWAEEDIYEEYEHEEEEDNRTYTYMKLLSYLEETVGCTAFRNVCAVTKDLAKYNNITLGELFQKYQG